MKPECGNVVQRSSKRPLKERGGIPDQEHPVLKSIAILAKHLKKAICLNRPYIQKYNNIHIMKYGYHPLPYIIDELANPKPHSFMTLLPCKESPSKTVLSLIECHYSMTTLLIWSKLTQSRCSSPFSHPKVLN